MVTADEIAVAYTPPGGWSGEIPPPILAECTEPLVAEAPDLRGLWQAVRVERTARSCLDIRLADTSSVWSSAVIGW